MEWYRLTWKPLVGGTIVAVASVFGVVWILERVLFFDAPLETLRYLYAIRGALASLVVMGLAIFFYHIRHGKTERFFQKLSLVVERSPNSIVVTDRLGCIEFVNRRFSQLTGYAREEVIGKKISLLKSGQTSPETYRILWATITSGGEWRGELLNKKKNGETYWEALSISPITNAAGEIVNFVGIFEDVTERKKLEQLKDEFVGIVSHELRTPFAIIHWSVGNLRDGLAGPLNPEQKEIMDGIHRNCLRLNRVVNDFLDLSRLESGRGLIQWQEIDLAQLLSEAIGDFQPVARERGIKLEEKFSALLPKIHVDSDLLVQVVENLIDNALRFAKSKVVVKTKRVNGSVQVAVADDGLGIAPEDLVKLFSKFEQVQRNVRQKGYKGTGLGLAICKEIIMQHRGRIWAESELSKGSTFYFTLPVNGQEKESVP